MVKYTLIRSDRRSMSLEVTGEGKIIVRAPRRTDRKNIEDFVSSHGEWIEKALARQRQRAEKYPEPDSEERERLIRAARELLPEKVERYAGIMHVCPTKITITGARKRFGSCSAKNSICFSWRLMRYPDEAVDYVVVHELAHILHKNHSRDFYACVEKYLPDHKQREKLLKG